MSGKPQRKQMPALTQFVISKTLQQYDNLNIKSPHAETRMGTTFVMAGAERIELSTHGFGDRCSTN